jgi:hypothetical protein
MSDCQINMPISNTIQALEMGKIMDEISRICTLNESGKLRWEKVDDTCCTYMLLNNYDRIIIQCCDHGQFLKINGRIISIPQDLLECLCNSVKNSIALSNTRETINSLQLIK